MSSSAYFETPAFAAPVAANAKTASRWRSLLIVALMFTMPLTQVVQFGGKSANMAASDLVLPFGVLFLAWQLLEGRLRLPLIGVCCLNIASIAVSLAINLDNALASKGTSGIIVEIFKVVSLWLLYYVFINAIRTRPDLLLALKTWLIGAVLVSLSGIAGALAFQMTRVLNDYSLMYRAQGTLGDANLYASYLAASFFLALFYRSLVKSTPKWLYAAMAIYLAGMFFSASRGSMLGFGASLAVLAFVGSSWKKRFIGAGLAVTAAAIVFLIPNRDALLQSNPFTERLATATVSINDDAAADRKRLWDGAMERFANSPIFGIGHGYYRPLDEPDPSNTIPVHDTYLGLLCETGIFGFVVYSLAFGLPSFRLWQAKSLGANRRYLLTTLLALGLCGLTISLENFRAVWVLIALMDAYRRTEAIA